MTKLTRGRLTGNNDQVYYVCTYGGSIRLWDSRTHTGHLRLMCHLELRRRGQFGTSKGREAIDTEMEKHMFGESMFAGTSLTMRHREDSDPRGLGGSSLTLSPRSC